MRVLGLAAAGMLTLTAPLAGHAAPSGSSMKQLVLVSGMVQVWGECRWGWQPVAGHWSQWRGGWVPPHCAPNHFYRRWGPYGAGQDPYGGWRPYGVWGRPY